jgi:hypothetical protein
MYRFSFFVVDMRDLDAYSPFHGEDQTGKLRFEGSSTVMMGGSEEAEQLVFGIYWHLSA